MSHLARLTLAVNADGCWQLDPSDMPNEFPRIALPTRDFPIDADTAGFGPGVIRATDARLAQEYAVALLRAARVQVPDNGLHWERIGVTMFGDREYPAYRTTWEVST